MNLSCLLELIKDMPGYQRLQKMIFGTGRSRSKIDGSIEIFSNRYNRVLNSTLHNSPRRLVDFKRAQCYYLRQAKPQSFKEYRKVTKV